MCGMFPQGGPSAKFARQGGSPGDLKKIKCAGDLGFQTNRYMGVRDSDRIPAVAFPVLNRFCLGILCERKNTRARDRFRKSRSCCLSVSIRFCLQSGWKPP